jgi:hypothetical protein
MMEKAAGELRQGQETQTLIPRRDSNPEFPEPNSGVLPLDDEGALELVVEPRPPVLETGVLP